MSRRPDGALSSAGRAVGYSSVILGAVTTLLILFGAQFGSLVQVESALQVSSFSDYQLLLRQSDVQGALNAAAILVVSGRLDAAPLSAQPPMIDQ